MPKSQVSSGTAGVNVWTCIYKQDLASLRATVTHANINHRVEFEKTFKTAGATLKLLLKLKMGYFTATHAAVYGKWSEGLRYLLSCKPDPELCTSKGYSLADVADMWGNAEVQQLVKEYMQGTTANAQPKPQSKQVPAPSKPSTQVHKQPVSSLSPVVSEAQVQRASDLGYVTSPGRPLPPFRGIRQQALQGLEAAVSAVETQLDLGAFVDQGLKWGRKLQKPKYGTKHNVPQLSPDEVAAVYLYTTESLLYRTLNAAMRSEDRQQAKPFFPYLRLLLSALDRIASCKAIAKPVAVWRGVRLHAKQLQEQKTSVTEIIEELKDKKEDEEELVWWAPSSCTTDMQTSIDFTGGSDCPDARVLFNVHTKRGVPIVDYSAIPGEAEVLQPPGSVFMVKNVASPAHKLWIVELEEIIPKRDLVA